MCSSMPTAHSQLLKTSGFNSEQFQAEFFRHPYGQFAKTNFTSAACVETVAWFQRGIQSLPLTEPYEISYKVQVKISSFQCVQLQLRCMGFQVEHLVHGREGVLQSMSIESGYLQQHRMMQMASRIRDSGTVSKGPAMDLSNDW